MGNVLAAIYHCVFAAASVYSGTAAGCTAVPPGTPPNPYDHAGYTGSYPRMQIWHGTADTTVVYHNFGEELKEWSKVLGASFTSNVTNSSQPGYTQMIYGNTLVGYSAGGVGHVVPPHPVQALNWFGFRQDRLDGGWHYKTVFVLEIEGTYGLL
ncbi:phb depolymerase family esterase [Seiridium cupressi]